jgi:NAD(P)-dependent dehydrogenase (short-subunit alcohol dehydrogenase family)
VLLCRECQVGSPRLSGPSPSDDEFAETDNGRAGTTADVAALVTFLASTSAGHVTGQVLHVNGGAYLGR